MRETTFIGIDVGFKGAVSVIRPDGSPVKVSPVPVVAVKKGKGKRHVYDEPAMRWLIAQEFSGLYRVHVYIEEVKPVLMRPGSSKPLGNSAQLNFGYGLWRGICAGVGVRYTVVPPRMWQKAMFAGVPGKAEDTKAASILACKRLFPSVSLKPTERCRVDNDGMADALLIAEYGRRREG